MSEADFVEPSSDSFWEIGHYKRTVKRSEDGYKLCNDIVQMIAERADLEKAYSKSLKAWSKKWSDYLQKGSEYGTMKTTWQASLNEADKLSEIHLTTHNALNDELNREIKEWQKLNYPKTIVNQLKITKEYEEEFKKAQKPWSKKYLLVEKTKKDYHSACKSFQSAKIQFQNSQADQQISGEQRKKLEDKVEKYKKEVELTKNKYKQALDDLNSYNSRYIEDMNNVYKKCDVFEKERLDFFIQKFHKLHSHLNIYEKMNIEDIYNEFMRTIKQTNPDKDLQNWSKEFGSGMPMNWPIFEEYSEQIKQIAKGGKKSDKDITNADANGGVTMTSIKHIEDVDTRSLSAGGNDNNQRFNNRNSTTSTATYESNIPVVQKSDIKILTNGSGSIRSAVRTSQISTQSVTSMSNNTKPKIEYPPEQNPFGDDDEEEDFTDDDHLKSSNSQNKTNNNITITSSSHINPSVPLKQNSTSSPLSVKTETITKSTTIIQQTTSSHHSSGSSQKTPNEYDNFQPNNNNNNNNKIPEFILYDNLNPDINTTKLNEYYDNPILNGPHSNNSRESNPFGEYDEDDESQKTGATNSQPPAINSHDSDDDDDLTKASYLSIRVRALYDYQSAEDDELSFKAGEEFTKLANEDERGWCLGKIGEKVGLYPATYATEI